VTNECVQEQLIFNEQLLLFKVVHFIWVFTTQQESVVIIPLLHPKKRTCTVLKEHTQGHTFGKSVNLKSLAPGAASPEGPQECCNKMAFIQSALIDELLNRVCTKQNFTRETFMLRYFWAGKSLWFDVDCLHFYGAGIKPVLERTGFSPRSSWSVWPGTFLGSSQ